MLSKKDVLTSLKRRIALKLARIAPCNMAIYPDDLVFLFQPISAQKGLPE
jgi:hypothetical protein